MCLRLVLPSTRDQCIANDSVTPHVEPLPTAAHTNLVVDVADRSVIVLPQHLDKHWRELAVRVAHVVQPYTPWQTTNRQTMHHQTHRYPIKTVPLARGRDVTSQCSTSSRKSIQQKSSGYFAFLHISTAMRNQHIHTHIHTHNAHTHSHMHNPK